MITLQSYPILTSIFTSAIIPFIVALGTYFFVSKWDENRRRRNTSKLGVVIIDCLIEEVKSGIKVMEEYRDFELGERPFTPSYPPRKSWNGLETISDDVLLRILAVSKNQGKNDHWHSKKIRIHCKNFFEYIVGNVTSKMDGFKGQTRWLLLMKEYMEESHYIKDSENVLQMLQKTRSLLDSNSKRFLPL